MHCFVIQFVVIFKLVIHIGLVNCRRADDVDVHVVDISGLMGDQ